MSQWEKHNAVGQILLWSAAWLLISFMLTNGAAKPYAFLTRLAPTIMGISIIVLCNLKLLLPHFYFKKKHLLFWMAGLFLLLSTVLLMHGIDFSWADILNQRLADTPRRARKASRLAGLKLMAHLTPLVITFLGSTLIEISRFANKKEKEAIELEKEVLETELKFLKSQVNPHFLFNALNNIYSLSVVNSPQTSESVMQLSEILRYMVYDATEERVPLANELKYIENYVELKLLKDSRGMDVQMQLDQVSGTLLIAPLLFIPFVENAFKHSKIENIKEGFVHITLNAEGKQIDFQVNNSLPQNQFTKDEVGGVGLENIRKRLDLLYPGDLHNLKITKSRDSFLVQLKMDLS